MNTPIPRIFPLGIRLQLMLWYTIVFAALLLFSGALFYLHLEHSLEANLDTTLEVRAQAIAGGITLVGGTITVRDVTGDLPGFDANPSDQRLTPVDADDELVRLLDAHGRLVRQTPGFRALRVPSDSITQPLHGTAWQGRVTLRDGQEVQLVSLALTKNGQRFAVIQVGQHLAELHTLLHDLVGELLVVGLLVLLACAVGSYWLAARAFAPIRCLAATARRIKAGDLLQRVAVPRARDEVQYLALTLNEMLDSLEQVFSRQRRFVADASHELRTPVAVIRNKTDVAQLWARTPQDYITVLEGVNAEAERLSHLISDLLALARGDEGRTQFERESVRLDLIAGEVAASTDLLAAEGGITLEVQAAGPVTIMGDEARLIQVVMNLVENAVRYTNSGGRVTVTVEGRQGQARLSVRDTGMGIAPEHLPHIFERFYRADPARRRNGSGSGLGLSIVEWVMHAHGGTVSVESQVGQGSCLTVTLPLASLTEERTLPLGSVTVQ
jgi:heavy metal sensor kinase